MRSTMSFRGLLLALVSLGSFVAGTGFCGDVELPPAPAGLILDKGNVLLPEHAAALSQRLSAAAAERGIWVYVVTVPTLGVPPSKQKERLVNLGGFYRDGWLKGRIGVVIFVDDESGAAMLAASEGANRRYPPLRRNMLLEEPLRLIGRETLRRNKIEKTALALVDVISRLQDEEQQAKHRDRTVALSLGGVLAAGVALILFVRWKSGARPKGESVSKPADSDSLS